MSASRAPRRGRAPRIADLQISIMASGPLLEAGSIDRFGICSTKRLAVAG